MGKKIYLLSPGTPRAEGFVTETWEIAGGATIPLGLYYLASFLREHGYEVAVADAPAFRMTPEDILKDIAAFAPAFVGISATTMNFANAAAMARRIKLAFPHVITIIGGSHVSSDMGHAMACRDLDFGVVGEGEITALELLNALCRKQSVSRIPGVVSRDETGSPVYAGPRPFIQDLDRLPFPALDLIPDLAAYTPPLFEHRALPYVNMITSRGCPGRCTFCATALGKTYRARSARNVFDEIKSLKKTYDIREIVFLDDNFLLDRQRIIDLFTMARAEGIFFHWTCLARINSVDYPYLKFLRDNGCWHISFGIESGDEAILKTVKKSLTLERTTRVVSWCHDLGIRTQGLFIIGHPTETVASIDRTIAYALDLPLDTMMCTINTPYPGTPQYGEVQRYGTLDTSDWSRFTGFDPVFVPRGLTKEILLEKQREIFVRFYARPGIILGFVIFFLGRGGVRRLQRLKAVISLSALLIRTAGSRR